jgi:hypothetical protein
VRRELYTFKTANTLRRKRQYWNLSFAWRNGLHTYQTQQPGVTPAAGSPRLLDQVRDAIRHKHFSLRSE